VAARTVLSLLLIACDTKLYRKKKNIKANTIKKTEGHSWGICLHLSTRSYLNKHLIRYVHKVRRFVIPCVHVVLAYCKAREVPCGEGVFGLSLEEGLWMQREYEDGLLLYMTLREDAENGYPHIFCHFLERKTA
jgi:hypothetical protein